MDHFLKKRSAEKNDSTPQKRKRSQFTLQGQLVNLCTHACGCFGGPELMTFPQNGYLFIYFLLHDWVNTFRLQTGLRWGNIFSGTDKEVYDRKYVSVCMRGHFISEKTNNIFICSLVLFPNCPTRPPCQELMVGCVWRARTVCLNVKTIRSRRLQGPGQQENSGIRTRTVCRFVFENTTGSNTFPNELHY